MKLSDVTSVQIDSRYAMKTLEKAEMLERNKVMRVLTEAKILSVVDHPFLASLYGTIVTDTHLHFLMQICEGGELYALLTSQPSKRFKESHVRFYTAEVGAFCCVPRQTGYPEIGVIGRSGGTMRA